MTTADDLDRWLAFQARDGQDGGLRILSPAGLALMHTPAPAHPYAMGWFSMPISGRQALFHNGILSTFYAEMTLFPDTGDGFVILANMNGFLPVRSAFPRLREGRAAFASKRTPPSAGPDTQLLGAGLFVAWLLAVGAALNDLWRRVLASATPERWRTAAGVALRLIPLAGLWVVPRHHPGKAHGPAGCMIGLGTSPRSRRAWSWVRQCLSRDAPEAGALPSTPHQNQKRQTLAAPPEETDPCTHH